MYDKEVIEFFRQRFSDSLKDLDWQDAGEQLLCHFLSTHNRGVLKDGDTCLKNFVKGSHFAERGIYQNLLKDLKTKQNALVIGDELGYLCHFQPNASYCFYSKEAMFQGKKAEAQSNFLLDELKLEKNKYHKIVVLQLMGHLKENRQVQNLGGILGSIFGSLHKKGELYIVDKSLYQDDFLIHLVSNDAEIASIQKYGPTDFLMRVLP